MALVVVRHGPGTTLLEREARLRAVERLDLTLLVKREHHGALRGIEIEPHDIAELGHERRIGRQLERGGPVRLEAMVAPEPRDRRLMQPRDAGHEAAAPMGAAI